MSSFIMTFFNILIGVHLWYTSAFAELKIFDTQRPTQIGDIRNILALFEYNSDIVQLMVL